MATDFLPPTKPIWKDSPQFFFTSCKKCASAFPGDPHFLDLPSERLGFSQTYPMIFLSL